MGSDGIWEGLGEPLQERRAIGGHQSPKFGTDEWLTPPEIITALGPFDLDPCAPATRPWPTAHEHYTVRDNGLVKPWHGRVWLNPPYGAPKSVGPWMQRMVAHGHGTALTFARTETELFFETIWKRATAVLFLRGRLHFHYVDGSRATANAGAPSVIAAYGVDDATRLEQSGIIGQYVKLR